MDQANLLERLVTLFDEHGIQYCVVGGQAVNAYVEPLVSLDLDLVVSVRQLHQVRELLNRNFDLKEFPHSLNASLAGGKCWVWNCQSPALRMFCRARFG